MDVPKITTACPECQPLLEQQQAIIDDLVKQIEKLTERLEKVECAGKRQAAPFRKQRKADPQKLGRKSGEDHGRHHRRAVPEKIDETYDVPLPACCPGCGHGELTQTDTLVQYQTEIPRTVIHRRFHIDAGLCGACGCRVQGRHELQTSGALARRLPSWGRTSTPPWRCSTKNSVSATGKSSGFWTCSSGSASAAAPVAAACCGRPTGLRRRIDRFARRCAARRRWSVMRPVAHGDSQSWRVDGRSAWLHAFVGLTATYYEMDRTRGVGPARRLLGIGWPGLFGHDGWSVYDQFTSATHQQCLAHLLRRCEALIERGTGDGLVFPRGVKAVLRAGLEVRNRFRRGEMTVHGLKVMAGCLTMRIWDLVRHPKRHPGNERFAKFLENHLEELFTFLRHPGADATNWRGEQAVRCAVACHPSCGGQPQGVGRKSDRIGRVGPSPGSWA